MKQTTDKHRTAKELIEDLEQESSSILALIETLDIFIDQYQDTLNIIKDDTTRCVVAHHVKCRMYEVLGLEGVRQNE